MSEEKENKFENLLQVLFFTFAGAAFLFKTGVYIPSGIFSWEGIIILILLLFVGYALFKAFDRLLVKIVRNLNV